MKNENLAYKVNTDIKAKIEDSLAIKRKDKVEKINFYKFSTGWRVVIGMGWMNEIIHTGDDYDQAWKIAETLATFFDVEIESAGQ